MKKILLGIVVSILMIAAPAFSVSGKTTTASGKCGESLTWTLYDDEKLTISGNGKMFDFSYGEAPWMKAVSVASINSIVIEEGVTSIGTCAFSGCSYACGVAFPSTLTSIGYAAFSGCTCDIHGYTGTYAQIYAEALELGFAPLQFIWTDNSEWGTPELKKAEDFGIFPEALKEGGKLQITAY